MSAVILLLLLFSKMFGKKTSPAKRYFCWVIVAVGLLVPFRPGLPEMTAVAEQVEAVGEWMGVRQPPRPSLRGRIYPDEAIYYQQEYSVAMLMDCSATLAMMDVGIAINVEQSPDLSLRGGIYPDEASYYRQDYSVAGSVADCFAALAMMDGGGLLLFTARILYTLQTTIAKPLILPQLLTAIWAMGVTFFTLTWAIRHAIFVRRLKAHSKKITSGPIYNLHILTCCGLGIKRPVTLKSCPIISVPVMYGMFRPVIVLPEANVNQSLRLLSLALLHETSHIKHRHILTRLLCLAALAIHWFNPLVHLMNRKALEESEKACDNTVIEYSGNENRELYSQTLLLAAKQEAACRKAARFGAVAYSLTGGGKKMKRRLSNILFDTTPKRWVLTICTMLMITAVLSLSLVSCGRETEEEKIAEAVAETQPHTPGLPLGPTPPPPPLEELEGETLTIAVLFRNTHEDFFRAFRRANPHITVEVIDFAGDWDRAREQISVMLMTGTAPTVIDSAIIDHMDPSTRRFLTDWFPAMRADPNFYEGDFFMNVFHAASINGRLYDLPLRFAHRPVMANSTIPGLTEALAERETITMSELMELHSQADTHLYFDRNFDIMYSVTYHIHYFFDFETGFVDFNNQQFIDMITHARALTNPTKPFGWIVGGGFTSPEDEAAWGQTYLFQFDMSNLFQYDLNFREDFIFQNPTRITNNQGELMITSWSGFALNAQATEREQALAWHYVNFTMAPENQRFVTMFPVRRDTFRMGVEADLNSTVQGLNRMGFQLDEPLHVQRERIIGEYEALFEMPMASMTYAPRVIEMDIIFEVLGQFNDGLITAEQAALYLQNRVTLAMMEME